MPRTHKTHRKPRLWPYLCLVLLHILIAANGHYPVIHPDEVIYRESSRAFAGVGPLPNLAGAFLFPQGYPLLISPLWRLFGDGSVLGLAVLVFNSLLASAVYFPVHFLIQRLVAAPAAACQAAAAVTGLYPAYFLIAGMWATDNAFVPLFAFLVVAAWRFFEAPSAPQALILGGLSAFLYSVHERALLVVPIVLALVLFSALRGHARWRVAGLAAAVIAVGFLSVQGLMAYVAHAVYRGDPIERPLLIVLSKLLSLDGWIELILQICGQGWYLLVATHGFVGIGAAVALRALWRERAAVWTPAAGTPAALSMLLLLVSVAAIFGSAAIYFPENPIMKAEAHLNFYGRICEGAIPVLLGLGLAWPASLRSTRRVPAAVGLWALVALALCAMMVSGHGMGELADDPGVWGVFGLRWFLDDGRWLLHPIVGTTVIGLVSVLAATVLRRRPVALALALGLSFLAVSGDLSGHYLLRREKRQFSRTLRAQVERLGADSVAMASWVRTGRYAEMISSVDVRRFSSDEGEPPPSELIITDREWQHAEAAGARFLVGERDSEESLWVRDGDLARRVVRPPDPHEVVYGAQAIWAVWESGFRERELWNGSRPMRWTRDHVQLRIPLGGARPSVLRVEVAPSGGVGRLLVRADGKLLRRGGIAGSSGSGDYSLEGVELGETLHVEIRAGRTEHMVSFFGKPDTVRRGELLAGLALLDAEEARLTGLEPPGEPLDYRIEATSEPRPRWATVDAPLVLTLAVSNTGTVSWPGGTPGLVASWIDSEGNEIASIRAPIPRPVLAGRRLRVPVAMFPETDDGVALPPGDYSVRVRLVHEGVRARGNPVEVPVAVRRHRPDRPFAPIRVLTRETRRPVPPYIMMPEPDPGESPRARVRRSRTHIRSSAG